MGMALTVCTVPRLCTTSSTVSCTAWPTVTGTSGGGGGVAGADAVFRFDGQPRQQTASTTTATSVFISVPIFPVWTQTWAGAHRRRPASRSSFVVQGPDAVPVVVGRGGTVEAAA